MGHGEGAVFLGDLALTLVAALVGGFAARAVRLPPLVGYLLAGIAVGPHTPGFIADQNVVASLANLGAALLMFAVGMQFSLAELNHVRRTALIGGLVQIAGTVALGVLLGRAFGWSSFSGVLLGCAMALSSTAVMMRILDERGELGAAHGTIMMGILLVQDLAVVPMAIVLPALAAASPGTGAATALLLALAKAAAFIVIGVLLATQAVPVVLGRVAATGSRELFLLTLVALCLAAGYSADIMGLGLALGAFIAGIVVSGSDYAHEAFSQVRPLRDIFASVFFVSVGMLLDPRVLSDHWPMVLAVVGAVVIGKSAITTVVVRVLGWQGRTSVAVGVGLAQIGEFSLVLTTMARTQGIATSDVEGIIYASALLTLMAAPFVFGSWAGIYRSTLRVRPLGNLLVRRARGDDRETAWLGQGKCPAEHTIIIGTGRVGRYVSDALLANGLPQVVVDFDTAAVAHRRAAGVPVIYGDAGSETVLSRTQPACARLAVVCLPDAAASESVVRGLRRMAPELRVVARVHRGADMARMRAAGADAVIHADFEAAAEMVRQSLSRLGFEAGAASAFVEGMRQKRYVGDAG